MTDTATTHLTEELASELYTALRNRDPITRFSQLYPDMTIDEAYQVSLQTLRLREKDGEKMVGKKIGLTAKAVQEMVGVNEPDYGFLTDAMEIAQDTPIAIAETMLTPMMEAEIALILKDDLPTENVTAEQVLQATEYACASLEIVDSRFDNRQITIIDTVADNASSALFVLGDQRIDPRSVDLEELTCTLSCNDSVLSTGQGKAVLGSPLISAAWLANKLGSYGIAMNAGDIILPGSLVPFAPINPGDHFRADFEGLGAVEARFS